MMFSLTDVLLLVIAIEIAFLILVLAIRKEPRERPRNITRMK